MPGRARDRPRKSAQRTVAFRHFPRIWLRVSFRSMEDTAPRTNAAHLRLNRTDRESIGLLTTALSAVAALCMLLEMGRRTSTAWRPINAAAHWIIGARADDVFGLQLDVTPVGCAVVLLVSAMAGFAVASLASSRRTLHRAMATGGVAAAGYLFHVHIVARSPGGLAALLSPGELRALYAAAAIALFLGMRYALAPVAERFPK